MPSSLQCSLEDPIVSHDIQFFTEQIALRAPREIGTLAQRACFVFRAVRVI